MNSLFAKILLWFWCTVAITVVGSAFISGLTVNQNVWDAEAPASRRMTFQLEEARAVYEDGGRPALQRFIDTLDGIYSTTAVLADDKGHDLLTDKDWTAVIQKYGVARTSQFITMGSATMARRSLDGKYWFISILPRPPIRAWFIAPEHIFWMLAAVLFCYWLALSLTSPVRALQKAVERFGRGDLTARVNSRRRDELGQLAGAFDLMAARIETLMAAERRLLMDISHELRSPLARLGVAIELARSGEDSDSALNRIQKESDRLNSLVGQLLQVTRAEGDPNMMRRDAIRLDQLVEQIVEDSGIEAASRGCVIRYQPPAPITIAGDPELIRRAVENVIRNAIRYSPRDSAIEVSLNQIAGKAVVEIRDHGPGVPEEALPRLFDAFYRVEPDRGRATGGIGLGLSITRRAVELHKGSIRASNASPGLRVVIELPVVGHVLACPDVL